MLVVAVAIALLRMPRRPVDIAAPHPLWTASILGAPGDTAELWIWTPRSTLRTNLPVPVTLRFRDKNLLIQVRSRQNQDMTLVVMGKDGSGSQGRLAAGRSESVQFLSVARIPFLPIERYGTIPFLPVDSAGYGGVNPSTVPLGIRPVFGVFPYLRPSGYEVVPDAVTNP